MAKRIKRTKKGTESLKKEIETHLSKIEEDIQEGKVELGSYHVKEIDRSLLKSLETKIAILKTEDNSVQIYKDKLEKLKKILNQI